MYDTRPTHAKAGWSTSPPPAPPRRESSAELVGSVSRIQQKALLCRTDADTALLEAFDLTLAYPGELAHLLAGIRAGLCAAGAGRESA